MKLIFRILSLAALVIAVSCSSKNTFSENDLKIIHTNPDSLLHIYSVENPQELEVLRAPSVNLTKDVLNSEDFRILKERMLKTVSAAGAKGLAAPQVGMLKRVCIVDVGDGLIELVNPVIVEQSGSQTGGEGCLSSPGEYGDVTRPMNVTVRAQDRNGNTFTVQGTELKARAFCHEIDHLNGILFKDKVEGGVRIEK